MNQKNQLNFIDLLSMASFCIGLMNLDENITQGDMQDLQQRFDKQTHNVLDEIHRHLEKQDAKLDEIIERLNRNDNRGNL